MEPTCSHHRSAPPTAETITRALVQAEARCEAAGSRLTEPRRRTLQLLIEADRPVKAYDLLAAFSPKGRRSFPATVYRALDFLLDTGLVHRIESLNAFVACAGPPVPHTAAFWICGCCGRAEEDLGLRLIDETSQRHGFRVDRVTLEMRGRCRNCI